MFQHLYRVSLAIIVVASVTAFGECALAKDGLTITEAAKQLATQLVVTAFQNPDALVGTLMARPAYGIDSPVPPNAVDRLSEQVVKEIALRSGGRISAVASGDIAFSLARAADEFRGGRQQKEMERIFKNAATKLILTPQVILDGEVSVVTYHIFEKETNKVVVSAPAVRVDLPLVKSAEAWGQAVQKTVDHFRHILPKMETLYHYGAFTYGLTRYRPKLGQYLERSFIEVLANAENDVITGNRLKVEDVNLSRSWDHIRAGLPVGDVVLRGRPAAYLLEGRYVVADGNTIEVTITLLDADNRLATHTSRVLSQSLPRDMEVKAQEIDILTDNRMGGPYNLRLIGSQGSYRIGHDDLNFSVTLAVDAYLYCFNQDDKEGKIIKLFPNVYHTDARVEAPQIVIPTDLIIPNALLPAGVPPGSRLRYPAEGPAGESAVKCYAAGQPLDNLLPNELARNTGTPIPGMTAQKLNDAFRRAAGTDLSEDSFVVTVVDDLAPEERLP